MIENGNQFLRVARITGAHGLTGRVKLAVITDIIERFTPGSILYLKLGREYKPFTSIDFIKQKGKNSLIKLENINDRNTALSLKGVEIYIAKDEAERTRKQLGNDAFYFYDLIGCRVFSKGKEFGSVTDIIEAGENIVLVMNDTSGKEFLIPFNSDMVDTKHIFTGRIDISPIDGLLEAEDPSNGYPSNGEL